MGLFSKKPDPKELRAFRRGKPVSGKAAEAYAQQQARKQAIRAGQQRRRAAAKGKGK